MKKHFINAFLIQLQKWAEIYKLIPKLTSVHHAIFLFHFIQNLVYEHWHVARNSNLLVSNINAVQILWKKDNTSRQV